MIYRLFEVFLWTKDGFVYRRPDILNMFILIIKVLFGITINTTLLYFLIALNGHCFADLAT